jgi:GNAT superfamily N-acetyltransferase
MNPVRIESMSGSDLKGFATAFCEAPQTLRQNPYRIGLLSPDADALFLTLPLPAPREFWIARRGDRIVGRIGASVSATDASRGTVGFFEVDTHDDEAAALLLTAAESWLRNNGARTAHGPIHFNTWFPYRFRVGGTDDRVYSWEPVNPPAYPKRFQAAGFEEEQLYHSELLDNLATIRKSFEQGHLASLNAGYTYRPIDTAAGLDCEIPTLYRLSVSGFVRNHLFEPIPEPVFRMLYVAQARKRKAIGCHFVSHPTEGDVGFVIAFLDEADQFVVKTVIVAPDHQSQGLSMGLLFEAFSSGLDAGYRSVVGALIQHGNRSEASSRRTTMAWQHTYALFRKSLT